MKNKLYQLFLYLCVLTPGITQNLVPNPGFEAYDHLPTLLNKTGLDFERAVRHWTVPNEASTDLVSPRLNSSNLKSISARSGNNMAGIVINGDFWAEYVGVKLKDSLVPGEHYYIEYWLSRPRYYSKKKPVPTYLNDHFGIRFDYKIYQFDKRIIERKPQVPATAEVFVEPARWTKVTGSFVADAPYNYLYLGHFWDKETKPEIATGYYFIDDIYVESFKSEAVDFEPSRYYQIEGSVASILMENIYFETDKYELLPESFEELDKLVRILKKNPGIQIDIHGHTDSEGSLDHNITLSKNRAKAVREYLETNGIPTSRLSTAGHGYTKPIADNATNEGRQQNRRVEFLIRGAFNKNGQPLGPEYVYTFSNAIATDDLMRLNNIGHHPDCSPTKGSALDEMSRRNFESFKRRNAKQYILSQTGNAQITILNGHDHSPRNRHFATSLLQKLYEQGYQYIGLEALSPDDTELSQRGYPVLSTGRWAQEPIGGQFLREALAMGFQLFSYAATDEQKSKALRILQKQKIISSSADPNDPEVQHRVQEWAEALNVTRILKAKPDAKILLYTSPEQAREQHSDGQNRFMAQWLHRFSGINPLTIDQASMQPLCGMAPDAYYSMRKVSEPSVFMRQKTVFVAPDQEVEQPYDIQVFFPQETTLSKGRPVWLLEDDLRKAVACNPDKHGISYPCLVLAYRAEEDTDVAVPQDVIELKSAGESKVLLLPAGDYKLVFRDRSQFKQLDRTVQ